MEEDSTEAKNASELPENMSQSSKSDVESGLKVDGSLHSESEDTDDESDEEFEPMFKYNRITQLPTTFFHKDAVSAILIHPMVFVFATHSGVAHLAKPDMTPIRTVRVHRASIVDIDTDGSYIATASIDGTIVVLSIEDDQDVTPASFNRPIHTVALDPNYKTTKCYLSGGTAGAVTKSEKGWLRARTDTKLYQSTSTILAIKWIGDKAIWCTEEGITIFDMTSSSTVEQISRLPNSPRANLYRPQIRPSLTDSRVLVGWGLSVWVLDLSQPVSLVTSFNVDWLVSGLSFFHDNILLLSSRVGEEPELRIIDSTGAEIYADELSLVDFDRLGPNDYHLAGSGPFFLVSAKDGVVARERTSEDHVDWLMSCGKYLEAYASSKDVCDKDTRKMIGLKATHKLIESDDWTHAAELLKETLDAGNSVEWEAWSETFLDKGHFFEVGNVLPISTTGLESVRTKILEYAINKSPETLLRYLGNWSSKTYDGEAIVSKLETRTEQPLVEARALLHLELGEPLRAVKDYLEIGSGLSFKVTSDFHLWSDALSLLPDILEAGDNSEVPSRLATLVANHHQVSPNKIVDQLASAGKNELLFRYLEQLGAEDELLVRDFGDLLVKLYGEYDRPNLMSFLTRNDYYDLKKAIEECEAQKHTEELVYLLGRVGQTQRALDLLLNQLNAVERAVEFAAQHDEEELWNALIVHSTSKPSLVLRLLKCPQVSPVQVLLKVPDHLKIDGLRSSLMEIFETQSAITNLNDGALAIFRSESKNLLTRLQGARNVGAYVEVKQLDADTQDEAFLMQEETRVIPVAEVENGRPFGSVSNFPDKIRHFGYLLRLLQTTKSAGY